MLLLGGQFALKSAELFDNERVLLSSFQSAPGIRAVKGDQLPFNADSLDSFAIGALKSTT